MIEFNTIRYKNILSAGNTWTEIDLSSHKTNLIVGTNGTGKSTILDALSFVLFGKPFRKINKPQLVNSINKKDLIVEIEFVVGSNAYKIVRGIKPNKFTIEKNGSVMDQTAAVKDQQAFLEENILNMNFKSFGQIVVLGSSTFVPFMQLSTQARRDIIEDLLDIQIFTTMNSLLKSNVSINRTSIVDIKHQIELLRQRKDAAIRHAKELAVIKDDQIDKLKRRIIIEIKKIDADRLSKDSLTPKMTELMNQISDKAQVEKKSRDILQVKTKLKFTSDRLSTDISFYDNNDACPTCRQDIDAKFKAHIQDEATTKNVKIVEALASLDLKNADIETRLAAINDINSKMRVIQDQIRDLDTNISLVKQSARSYKNEIESLQQNEKAQSSNEDDVEALQQEISSNTTSYENLLNEREMLSVAAAMLKDGGIKAQIIKQYIPIVNTLVNKYLKSMDLFVQFELDETFSETIKSRYRDEFTYASFSEGEKMRIDLALLLTWRAISRMRNSVSTNLLIMDEIMDSSLDNSGQQDYINILKELTSDMNVYIISHKTDNILDHFDRTIKFEKVKNFSRIAA